MASVQIALPDGTIIATSGDDREVAGIIRQMRDDFRVDGGCWFRGVEFDPRQASAAQLMLTWVPSTAVVRAYFDNEGPDDFGQADVWVQ